MDNQHKLIRGYRDLSEEEIESMNAVKAEGEVLSELCLTLRERVQRMPTGSLVEKAEKEEALRWLDAGELQLQQGLMAITRSIARPTSF